MNSIVNVRIKSNVYKQLKLMKLEGDFKSVSDLLADLINKSKES
jgi:predicted CopG family antitoxin